MMAAIDPVMLEMAAPNQVSERVHQMLEEVQTERSSMLMTSSKPTVTEANLRAVAAVMRAQGKRSSLGAGATASERMET